MPNKANHTAAAKKVYKSYWDSYMKGDLATFASTLDEDFEMIGTSESEVAHNKAEGIAFFKAQMQEVVGKAEMRNRAISTKPVHDMVLINENCDIYVLAEPKWTFYSKIRISTLLRETGDGWKVIQQHGSLPDMRVQEGETLAIDKITVENLELRDAVRRRTIELENKSRELEIEAALERVRASTMAMQSSEALSNVAAVLFKQMKNLGGDLFAFGIVLCDKHKDMVEQWHSLGEGGMLSPFLVPVDLDYIHRYRYDRWKAGEQLFSIEIPADYIAEHFNLMFELPSVKAAMDEVAERGANVEIPEWEIDYGASFSHGYLLVSSLKHFEEDHVFPRFAQVFDQAYTRFLDLKKAETQAREAQIEAALERVRARSMAMQKSDELKEVIQLVYDQFVLLEVPVEHTGFIIDYDTREDMYIWLADKNGAPSEISIPYFDSPHWNSFMEAKQEGIDFFANKLSFDEKNLFYKELFSYIPDIPEKAKKFYFDCPGLAISTVLLDNVGLYIENFAGTPYHQDENAILMRFGKVFQQVYTRFRDLQKAEAQAREAQIEAALERIRSRTMAMRHSDELMETSGLLFREFVQLGARAEQLSIGIIEGRNQEIEVFGTFRGNQLDRVYKAKADDHQVMRKLFDHWAKKKDKVSDVLVVEGEELSSYNKWRNKLSKGTFNRADPKGSNKQWIIHIATFKQGVLSLSANEQATPETMQLLRRFAGQFEQTYTRFLDLKKAEAQAREAVKQASLDRVRGEIASMRSAEDLQRMTPILFKELKTLGVPFFRCGVFILDAQEKHIDAYLSDSEGAALTPWRLGYDTIPLFAESVQAWQKQEVFRTGWDKDELIAFARILSDRGLVKDGKHYLDGEHPPEKLSLHLVPFVQGMLYVGNTRELTDEQIELVRSLADTFSIAYARFDDFRLLEMANEQIKETLEELRTTQKQLIHAEKMASLGELTAGIAHEIQNPLNFVNNFSEVNSELIEELEARSSKLKAYLPDGQAKEDLNEVDELLKDIRGNEQKIKHHGQRASGIVKGMLEHSRSGSGKKEPTDINALADEYLRLAYHGLRAKDKSFNADFKAELDENLPTINVVSQDIGRVLLNLINNAFYAVSKKAKAMPLNEQSQYKPTVSVKTRLVGDGIEIRVMDNADGIPKDVLDKIFQPFFTTKPTGEGTGLGLSLSYDIVTKGHGGALEVQSEVGKGTEFIVKLPEA